MISQKIISELSAYWRKRSVPCQKISLSGILAGTDISEILETIGIPSQTWWLFRFEKYDEPLIAQNFQFGRVGDWDLFFRLSDGACVVIDGDRRERFVNSNFLAFMRMLVAFDEGFRRIQGECPGDSGEDWDRGDVIVENMERTMRDIDARAFDEDSNLWPYLLVDING